MALDDKLVRKKLEVLLRDETLVGAYLQAYGPKLDMKWVQTIKEKAAVRPGGVQTGNADDPYYRVDVKCPVCLEAGIPCYELKSKSLLVTLDKFLVPRYQGVKGFKTLDYSLYAVTICPKCLFASPDKRDFITMQIQTRTENKSQLSQWVLKELKEKEAQRREVLAETKTPADLFKIPRSVEAATLSYRLSVLRALIEAGLETPSAWYKAGMYCLKVARLQRDIGKDDEEILREALKHLLNSYRTSELKNPGLEFQLLYLVVALHLRLQDIEGCQSHLSLMDKALHDLKARAELEPDLPVPAAEKWLVEAKDLWSRREDADLWQH